MIEQVYDAPGYEGCPSWCANSEIGEGSHAHGSAVLESPGTALTGQLVQVSADDEPRVLINGHVTTPGEARAFAGAVLRLADQATLAPSGLDLIITLARGRVTLAEMALASGFDVERLQDQQAGGQLLSVHDVDQLALAVARLIIAREAAQADPQNRVHRRDVEVPESDATPTQTSVKTGGHHQRIKTTYGQRL